jgi:hypothetical protein
MQDSADEQAGCERCRKPAGCSRRAAAQAVADTAATQAPSGQVCSGKRRSQRPARLQLQPHVGIGLQLPVPDAYGPERPTQDEPVADDCSRRVVVIDMGRDDTADDADGWTSMT